MFQISAQAKYTYFHERLQYYFNKKLCMTLVNINNTHFKHTRISVQKTWPDIDKSNNYDVLYRFL